MRAEVHAEITKLIQFNNTIMAGIMEFSSVARSWASRMVDGNKALIAELQVLERELQT